MARQRYKEIKFKPATLDMIRTIGEIVIEYQIAGYVLTARQMFYQLVARGIIENTLASYKNTTNVINDAKLAGLLDWDMFEDRTREFEQKTRWEGIGSMIRACAEQYHEDMWVYQPTRVFCIVEKEALFGVLERVCREWDVPLLAARGYPSSSVLRKFCQEMVLPYGGQDILILHLGDHDPSGVDMSRDLDERINMFAEDVSVDVQRIALNMEQVHELNPPPNPAKVSDSRADAYIRKYGRISWELDAIEPQALHDLVKLHILNVVEPDAWAEREAVIEEKRIKLEAIADEQED